MKRNILSILFFFAACGAAHAATTGVIVVTWSATAVPTPCSPASRKLGTLPACPANTTFVTSALSVGGSKGYSATGPANIPTSFQDVSLTKNTDPSSSALFLAMLGGTPLGNVLISSYSAADLNAAGTGTPIASYSITLTGARVESINDGATKTTPVQFISLNYTTIHFAYIVHNSTGTQDSLAFTYNTITNALN